MAIILRRSVKQGCILSARQTVLKTSQAADQVESKNTPLQLCLAIRVSQTYTIGCVCLSAIALQLP